MEQKQGNEDQLARLALCALLAAGVVYAGAKYCPGKGYPLWDKYGPWIAENKVRAIAGAAALLYVLSLALWPQEKGLPGTEEEEAGFTPCQ